MSDTTINYQGVGRNDVCPCGSGKKFKKCHGLTESAEWQGFKKPEAAKTETGESGTSESANGSASSSAMGGLDPSQFDPSKMDLNWLAQFSSAIQRLPKGQLQRFQSLMQKAMAGKDVKRELEEFQRTLPPSVQELLTKSPDFSQATANEDGKPSRELTDEEKAQLAQIQKSNEKSGLAKLWNKFRNK